jgi:ribonuclease P protein component
MTALPEAPRQFGSLRSSQRFRTVYQQGQRFYTPYFTAFILLNDSGAAWLGITATRKIGNAVLRNRCKRRLREVFRRQQVKSPAAAGYDIVVNAKPELATADFKLIEEAFAQTLQRFGAYLAKQAGANERPATPLQET